MGVPSTMISSNYTPKASDDVSLDSATTLADKNEKMVLNSSTSTMKRKQRRSGLSLRKPVLISDNTSVASASSSPCRIRHRYLSKLGVAADASFPKSSKSNSQRKSAMPVGVLKTSDSKPATATTAKPNNVRFETQVSVQLIPDKRELNNPEDLWIQKDEFQELYQRNSLEYAADGWNWEHATEESDFVSYHNQLIHPAHFRGHNPCNMQRHFLMNMYAQRQSGC